MTWRLAQVKIVVRPWVQSSAPKKIKIERERERDKPYDHKIAQQTNGLVLLLWHNLTDNTSQQELPTQLKS
jgi:hypothetical protein